MTKKIDQRVHFDLERERQIISSMKPLRPEFSRGSEYYKKKMLARQMTLLAKHRERIRDGLKGDDGMFPSKGVKLSQSQRAYQRWLRYRQEALAKMVQAQEEAVDKLIKDQEEVDKLINEQGMPDASYENFCSSYNSLTISS